MILLNSLFKKLVLNEGVHSDDDLYSPECMPTLQKIRKILKVNQDVQNSLKILDE